MVDWAKCSLDQIPMKAIRLSEAFEQVKESLWANPQALQTLHPSLLEYLNKNKQQEEARPTREFASRQSLDSLHRRKEAVVFFRSTLGRGKLIAYIRDPEDGAILELDPMQWGPVGGRLLLLEPPEDFTEDFLDYAPFLGNPNTLIRGAYRPIFFWRKEFALWLSEAFGAKRREGRPVGSGSYLGQDMPYLEKMHAMIKAGEVKSAYEAACKVVKDVPLRNALESSVIRRLHKNYGSVFGSERN